MLCSQALSTPGFFALHGPSCSFQKVLAGLLQPLAGAAPLPATAFLRGAGEVQGKALAFHLLHGAGEVSAATTAFQER